jgi:glutathione synthase/RimK-type ligase-like ATP-grasp enzyme
MKLFGILTLNINSENTYFTEMAKRAANHGVICFRFIPSDINLDTLRANGYIFDILTYEWKQVDCPIPKVLYDRCFYSEDEHSKHCSRIVAWLKKNTNFSFLGYGLPNKLEIFQSLAHTPLNMYLPPTVFISDTEMIQKELATHTRIVLKPINGSGGNGILFLEEQENQITIKTYKQNRHIQKIFHNKENAFTLLKGLTVQRGYLLQPYLALTNENSEPFDIRIFLQKGEDGNWIERGRGIRRGSPKGILSNIQAGGYVDSYHTWIRQLNENQRAVFEDELRTIISSLPIILENTFLPLFELGVDIGYTNEGKIWILDINSKPGRKVLLHNYPNDQHILFEAPILYAKRLILKNNERKRNNNAKTLPY